jgi:hypothetical protein
MKDDTCNSLSRTHENLAIKYIFALKIIHISPLKSICFGAWHRWHMPLILVTWEAEIEKMAV